MNKKTAIWILLIIFIIQALQLIIWIKKDDSLPAWDQSWHAMISLNLYNQFFHKTDLTTRQIETIYPIFNYANNFYPPFFHIVTIPFYAIFGISYDTALLTNILFLALLILSSYFIGKKLYNRGTGLLLAFIVSTIPAYSYFMRHYLIDFSLSSMVALGFVLLLYTGHFRDLKYSLLSGLVLGLGILTKWSYPLFLSMLIISVLFSVKDKIMLRLRNIALSFLCAGITAAAWYSPSKIQKVLSPFIRNVSGAQGALEGDPGFCSLEGLTHYLFVVIRDYSFIYFFLFLIAVVILIRVCKKNKRWIPVLINLLAIYAICTLVKNKDNRFILPVYIFLAAISAMGVCCIENKKIKYGVVTLVVFLGLFQNLLYNLETINVKYKIGKITLFDTEGIRPSSSGTDITKILEAIKSTAGGHFSVCIIAESNKLNDVNIPYFALRGNYQTSCMVGNGCNPLHFDYVILGPIHKTWRSDLFERSKVILNNNINNFKLIYSGKKIHIYERIK